MTCSGLRGLESTVEKDVVKLNTGNSIVINMYVI